MTDGNRNIVMPAVKVLLTLSVFVLCTTSCLQGSSNLVRVGDLKIGQLQGRFAILLPLESDTDIHEIQRSGSYAIYFRNAVVFHGGEKYRVGENGVQSISIEQVKPDVVAMMMTLDAGCIVETAGYDSERNGYVFFTTRRETQASDRGETALEIEAQEELARYRKYLEEHGGGARARLRRVVIDPGHGGFDSGAVGPSGLQEKDVVLDIAKRVKRILDEETDIYSFLTRRGDYYIPLSARTVISNKYRADLFVSIHANASKNSDARGFEAYYCSERASSKEAEEVAKRENISFEERDFSDVDRNMVNIEEIVFKAGRKKLWDDSRLACDDFISFFNRGMGVQVRQSQSANFFVLRKARMTSVLVEVAFISNPEEEKLLGKDDFRERLAREIVKLIRNLKTR